MSRTQNLCPQQMLRAWANGETFVSATNVSQFAQPKKHHGQQCVRNNVFSFARALMEASQIMPELTPLESDREIAKTSVEG